MKSFSETRKSRTSACRRFTSSTRRMPHNRSWGRKLPGVTAAAVAGAAGDAAGAAAAAAAGGAVAGGRRNSCRRKRAVSTALGSSVFAAITSAGCRNLLQCAASQLGCVVAHDKAGVQFLDRPGRREAAGSTVSRISGKRDYLDHIQIFRHSPARAHSRNCCADGRPLWACDTLFS